MLPAIFISEIDFARMVGLTVFGVRAWRRRAYGPPAGKLGKKIVYRRSDVDQFLASVGTVDAQ